jgi:hypothetical protein
MVQATKAAFFISAQSQRRASVGAALVHHAHLTFSIAKHHQILTE